MANMTSVGLDDPAHTRSLARAFASRTHVEGTWKKPKAKIEDSSPTRYLNISGLEVIKFEFILRLKIKRNDWLLADTCPQAANHCALFCV